MFSVFFLETYFCFSCTRNEWGPPDRKVDTRKYRAEPKSIFEYEPGKSSILEHERPVSIKNMFFDLILFNPDIIPNKIQ